MQVFRDSKLLRQFLQLQNTEGKSVGFVPTMGSLHPGHISLVKHALQENDLVVVSIFVNPTQFNNAEDLHKYPRTPEKDLKLLEENGCQVAFLPDVNEMYPEEVASRDFDLGGFDEGMEGAHRPGHFDGVATVVMCLFSMVEPNRAYFGEKDYQQLLIIKHLSGQLHPEITIVPHPIERSPEGLALSSRNRRLSNERKKESLAIFNALEWAQNNYNQLSPAAIQTHVNDMLKNSAVTPEYVAIADAENLKTITEWEEAKHARLFVAGHLEGVRLIDNILLF